MSPERSPDTGCDQDDTDGTAARREPPQGSPRVHSVDQPPLPIPLCPTRLPSEQSIGGQLKAEPDDFEVEELPAYEPCGEGEHLFLWIEKRDLSGPDLRQYLARTLRLPPGEIGMAGLKDRRAITRQYVSVPARLESQIDAVQSDWVRVLSSTRHTNKLKTGHLFGNRFRIRLRGPDPAGLPFLAQRIRQLSLLGVPNYFGEQRFGHDQQSLTRGLKLLSAAQKRRPKGFRDRLAISAVQSWLFNQALSERCTQGRLDHVVAGDVLLDRTRRWAHQLAETDRQLEVDAGPPVLVPSGPLFGPRMPPAAGSVAESEQDLLEKIGLTHQSFARWSKLSPGGRRPYLVWPVGLKFEAEPSGVLFEFELPAGSYATVVLRELQGDRDADQGELR